MGLTLEPFAVRQRWTVAAPLRGEAWMSLLSDYLAALARACASTGPCLIGHIKLLALFGDGDYLRISTVSSDHAPTISGSVPDGLLELTVTLNVLVYGLAQDVLQDLTRAAAASLAATHAVHVDEEPLGGDTLAPDGHDHHHTYTATE